MTRSFLENVGDVSQTDRQLRGQSVGMTMVLNYA